MASVSYFYVLYCQDSSLYAGYTTDLKRRLSEHNSGQGAKYTRPLSRRPVTLLYAQAYGTKSEAMQAEYAFKQLTRPQKECFLQEQGVCQPYEKLNHPVIQHQLRKDDEHEESKEL